MNDTGFNKLRFLNKFGSEGHKAKADGKIGEMIDHGDTPTLHRFASSTEVDLKPEHVHKIIDHTPQEGFTHPAVHLTKWNKPSVKDEHWDRLAKHPDPQVALGAVPHMSMHHVKKTAEENPDDMVRVIAANHYRRQKEAGRTE
jgi:hypothetical protein